MKTPRTRTTSTKRITAIRTKTKTTTGTTIRARTTRALVKDNPRTSILSLWRRSSAAFFFIRTTARGCDCILQRGFGARDAAFAFLGQEWLWPLPLLPYSREVFATPFLMRSLDYFLFEPFPLG